MGVDRVKCVALPKTVYARMRGLVGLGCVWVTFFSPACLVVTVSIVATVRSPHKAAHNIEESHMMRYPVSVRKIAISTVYNPVNIIVSVDTVNTAAVFVCAVIVVGVIMAMFVRNKNAIIVVSAVIVVIGKIAVGAAVGLVLVRLKSWDCGS